MSLCEFLPWDSDFFGMRIARLKPSRLDAGTAGEALQWCHVQQIECLYFLADADDPVTVTTAEQNGFTQVDIRLTLKRSLADYHPVGRASQNLIVRSGTLDDLPALKSLAMDSFSFSRFYFDPRFPRERCDALYTTWIDNSFHGFANQVIVSELDRKPVGFITCRVEPFVEKQPAMGEIGLVGIAADVRGRGIGAVLVTESLSWFADAGVQQVLVVTQGRNLAAQRLYQRCGFLSQKIQLWYHKWMETGAV